MAAWETQGAIGKAKEVAAKATDEAQDETGERRKSVGLAGKMAEKGWSRCSCFARRVKVGKVSHINLAGWLVEKKKKKKRNKAKSRTQKLQVCNQIRRLFDPKVCYSKC